MVVYKHRYILVKGDVVLAHADNFTLAVQKQRHFIIQGIKTSIYVLRIT